MGNAPATGVVFTASDVARVAVRLADGRLATFRTVEVAGTRKLGNAIPPHAQVTSTREYGSHGQLVGSQAGQAVGSAAHPGCSCAG
jgi:hypothetical protein